MITYLRNHAQSWFIKALLSVVVLTFIISFGVGTFSNPKEVLVKIGPIEIMVNDYMELYGREFDRLSQRYPDNADMVAQQLNLRRQVYERLVNRQLILLHAEGSGLRVSDDEVQEAVRREPGFQGANGFDFNLYQTILSQNRLTPNGYEARLREDLIVEKFTRNLFAGVMLDDADIAHRYRIGNEKVAVDYVFVDPARFSAKAKVSNSESKAYYEKHKNEFMQPAQFRLRYFVMSTKLLLPKTQVRERAVARYYERNLEDRFTIPGRVHAQHILKEVASDAKPEQEQAARKALLDLRQQALDGADFAELAKKHSEGPSASKGGDLGFFKKDEMLQAFSEAAFAMQPGEISEPVRSSFGLHLIKVIAVEAAVVKTLSEVREDILVDLKNDRAERKLSLEADRLPQRIEKDGIEAAAAALGVALESTPLFDAAATLPAIGSTGPLYGRLRNAQQGDAGVLRRNPIQGHLFYQVLERKAAFVKPLQDVLKAVAKKIRTEKGAEEAVATAKEAFAGIKSKAQLKAFADKYTLFVKQTEFSASGSTIPDVGGNRDFQRKAFGLSADAPFALSINARKAYLLRFRQRSMPKDNEAERLRGEAAQRVEREMQQYYMNSEIGRLKSEYPVELLVPELVNTT